MLVLHATWQRRHGHVLLWAEDADAAATATPAPKGLTPTGRSGRPGTDPQPHPFAASSGQLAPLLSASLAMETATHAQLVALELPTVGTGPRKRPMASPELESLIALDAKPGRAAPSLHSWQVPALALGPAHALDLASPGAWAHARPSASIRWFSALAELALSMVARGRVLPALGGFGSESRHPDKQQGPLAWWMAMPTPEDLASATRLAGSMPAAVRAAVPDPRVAGEAPNPSVLTVEIILALADAAVRQAIARAGWARPKNPRRKAKLSPEEALFDALASPQPVVPAAPAGEVVKLAALLEQWRRPVAEAVAPLRTCFRLDPPSGEQDLQGEEAPWGLRFFLQPAADPSLLVPAAEVWASGSSVASLGHAGRDPRLQLLADLGHASRLFPELDAALQAVRPESAALSSEAAYRFLSEAAPLFEQAGLGVLLPPWWRTSRSRLGLKVKASPSDSAGHDAAGGNGLNVAGLCQYSYEVALGDATLSAAELRELARLKMPLVRVKGQWVELRPEELQAALEVLERQRRLGPTSVPAAEVLRVALELDAKGALPVVDVEATGWLGDLLNGEGAAFEPVPTPSGFAGSLRPYQQRGLAWLAWLDRLGMGACLADDMGLGKTPQLLALLLREREEMEAASPKTGRARKKPASLEKAGPGGPGPTLLVCPMSVVGNWQKEAAHFSPSLSVHVHHGSSRSGGTDFAEAVRGADLVVTTYNLLARDAELISSVPWRRLVLDEAQYIKNAGTQQARAARAVRAPRRVALTGTPVENRLSELWSIMEVLNPGLLGSRESFRRQIALPVERYGDEEAEQKLRKATRPFILRRLKTDRSIIADLPDKIEMKVFCNLTKEQATLYQAVVDDMLARLEESDGMSRKGLVLATMMKLKQVCNHPAHLLGDSSRLPGRSGKLARLEDILGEVAESSERALVFTQFWEMGDMLRSHLQDGLGSAVPFLHGGVPKKKRDVMVESFQNGGAAVMIVSLKAGGVGLNLTAANHVVHFDRWWNPAVEDQATDRAFRIGQSKNVQVRKFMCAGTLEERIDAMMERKRGLAERIVGTGEAWLTELSNEQIRDLVALSAEAVAE